MGALELARRVGLLAGVCGALWYALWSPPVLIEVRRADFAAEYERRYGERKYPLAGAIELGREFLRRNTHPGSLDAFIVRTTEGRLLPFGGAEWSDLYRRLSAPMWFAPDQPPVRALLPDIETVFRRAQWTSMYLPVSGGHLEFRYQTRPRKCAAPASLVYPLQARAGWWLAAGVALWLLLPWPARDPATAAYDRLPIRALDALATLFSGIFFALPLYFANSTAEAMGEDFGGTLFCWALALALASILLWTAKLSAWAVRAVPGGLRIEGLLGARTVAFSDITGAARISRGAIHTGYCVRMRDGSTLVIPWAGVLHPEAIAYALAAAQVKEQ